MNSYNISARDYLARAIVLLDTREIQNLFYAAFELRCGIESRMQEYLAEWEHISTKKKKGWKISTLHRDLEREFKVGDRIVRWAVHDKTSHALVIVFYHTPVTAKLKKEGEQLGNVLHSAKVLREPEDDWWGEFRQKLVGTADLLSEATTGTLLGPPLQKSDTGQAYMNSEIPDGVDSEKISRALSMGAEVVVNVEYLDELPSPVEKEAIVWART